MDAVTLENITPLEYLLRLMRDPSAAPHRRDRAAITAAPYLHARAVEKGKKSEREEKAARAGRGKFAPSKPPLMLLK